MSLDRDLYSSLHDDLYGELNIDLNIDFKTEVKFEECVYKSHLKFDFYIPDLNLCIEYNGLQHYKSVDFFGGA